MSNTKGFTLVEIIICLVIVGVLAAISVPTYTTILQQGSTQAAQKKLMTIYYAEKNYQFQNNHLCTHSTATGAGCGGYPSCGETLAALNCNLSLNIVDNNFSYECLTGAVSAHGLSCQATNNTDSHLILKITNNPVVLNGGTGCTSNTGANPGCNPSCATDITPYCPS